MTHSEAAKLDNGQIPPRPTLYDPSVTLRAAEITAPAVLTWLRGEGEKNVSLVEVVDDLVRVLKHNAFGDGYELARSLEDECGYSPNAELVEQLDGYPTDVALKELEMQWVKAYNISLDLPIGTQVQVLKSHPSQSWIGIIRKHYPENAHYGVENPNDNRNQKLFVVRKEDLEALPQQPVPVTEPAQGDSNLTV